jgi:hypothetical protein
MAKRFRGVTPENGVYIAHIKIEGRPLALGRWLTAKEAALAFDRAALHYRADRPLNLAGRARKLGPASPGELRRLAVAARKANRGAATSYLGVSRRADGRWEAACMAGDESHTVSGYATAEDAAVAYDRLALHLHGARARRNVPERNLTPATAEVLRRELRFSQAMKPSRHTYGGRETASRYVGVVFAPKTKNWLAQLRAGDGHVVIAGYRTEFEAAVARDRLARFLAGPDAFLNFPEQELSPASERELRRELRASANRRRGAPASRASRQGRSRTGNDESPRGAFGVIYSAKSTNRPWLAFITPRNCAPLFLGHWETEREAARAHDRAAIFYHGHEYRWLNDPKWAKRAGGADAATLRGESTALFKETTTSRFRGVSFSRSSGRWVANIRVGGRQKFLGRYAVEEDAARAFDKASLKLRGLDAALNFHPETGEELPGTKRLRDLGSPLLKSPVRARSTGR